ncbi:MAG: hypothetical protein IKO36_03660 [Bacteroidaceae bacterium]|nr:hypothetical protein [Bacteroidaceae bacterium]
MNLISYMYTCGGDAKFRCGNSEEWKSCKDYLYFDNSKWTMNSIADEMRRLWHAYENLGYAMEFSNVTKNMYKVIRPFVNTTDGVYQDMSHKEFPQSKTINPKEHNIIRWNIDGNEYNSEYCH